MAIESISFKSPRPKDGTGMPVAEGCRLPKMRARTGRRGSDKEMIKLLESAMDGLAESNCNFWACNGPQQVVAMCTCRKCYAMREIGTVIASLKQRGQSTVRFEEQPFVSHIPSDKSPDELAGEIVADLQSAIKEFNQVTNEN